MFEFLKNLTRRRAETPCSRFGGVKAFPASPEEAADMRRLEAARDAAWKRSWLAAQNSATTASALEREACQ